MGASRGDRRRQERAAAKGRPIALLTETGSYERWDGPGAGQLPAKVPGHHRWVLTTAYAMDEALLARALEPDPPDRFFDHENRLSIGVGCWDCERPYPEIKPGSTCPAAGDDT